MNAQGTDDSGKITKPSAQQVASPPVVSSLPGTVASSSSYESSAILSSNNKSSSTDNSNTNTNAGSLPLNQQRQHQHHVQHHHSAAVNFNQRSSNAIFSGGGVSNSSNTNAASMGFRQVNMNSRSGSSTHLQQQHQPQTKSQQTPYNPHNMFPQQPHVFPQQQNMQQFLASIHPSNPNMHLNTPSPQIIIPPQHQQQPSSSESVYPKNNLNVAPPPSWKSNHHSHRPMNAMTYEYGYAPQSPMQQQQHIPVNKNQQQFFSSNSHAVNNLSLHRSDDKKKNINNNPYTQISSQGTTKNSLVSTMLMARTTAINNSSNIQHSNLSNNSIKAYISSSSPNQQQDRIMATQQQQQSKSPMTALCKGSSITNSFLNHTPPKKTLSSSDIPKNKPPIYNKTDVTTTRPLSNTVDTAAVLPTNNNSALILSSKLASFKTAPLIIDLSEGDEGNNVNDRKKQVNVTTENGSSKSQVTENKILSTTDVRPTIKNDTMQVKRATGTNTTPDTINTDQARVVSDTIIVEKNAASTSLKDNSSSIPTPFVTTHVAMIRAGQKYQDPVTVEDQKKEKCIYNRPQHVSDPSNVVLSNNIHKQQEQLLIYNRMIKSNLAKMRGGTMSSIPTSNFALHRNNNNSIISPAPVLKKISSESAVSSLTPDQVLKAMPQDASCIFHILDRRVNFDAFASDVSFYSLLRAWVQDDPYRQIPPTNLNILDYDQKWHVPFPPLLEVEKDSGDRTIRAVTENNCAHPIDVCASLSELYQQSQQHIQQNEDTATKSISSGSPDDVKTGDTLNVSALSKGPSIVKIDIKSLLSIHVKNAKSIKSRKRKKCKIMEELAWKRLKLLGISKLL